jgi:hypothetical protein
LCSLLKSSGKNIPSFIGTLADCFFFAISEHLHNHL